MSNTQNLLPCAFCGGMATAKPIDSVPGWHHVTVLHSDCFYKPAQDQMLLNDEHLAAWNRRTPQPVVREPQCWCLTCKPMRIDDPSSIRMALCPTCGNKRCPKANDYRNQCSNSNEPGQKGSAYEWCGITQKGGSNAE